MGRIAERVEPAVAVDSRGHARRPRAEEHARLLAAGSRVDLPTHEERVG
jgi:hypothetical protein